MEFEFKYHCYMFINDMLDEVEYVFVTIIMYLWFSGGYKGYGLGMMVEVFCGILAGAHYSKYVRTWKVTDRVADLVSFSTSFFFFRYKTSCKSCDGIIGYQMWA